MYKKTNTRKAKEWWLKTKAELINTILFPGLSRRQVKSKNYFSMHYLSKAIVKIVHFKS